MKRLEKLDLIVLGIISVFSIIITILDFFDITKDIPSLNNLDYSVISVLILSLIGFHLVSSHIKQNDSNENLLKDINNVLDNIKGVKVINFSTIDELEKHIATQIRKAKIEICDLTWKDKISSLYSVGPRKRSQRSYDSSISKISNSVTYKEVFIFSDLRRIDKLKKRLEENKPGYSCRYFPEFTDIPRIQFVLIDKSEIIFASSSYPKYCSIRHKELSEIFKSYFDSIWEKAIPIKDGTNINTVEVEKILKNANN